MAWVLAADRPVMTTRWPSLCNCRAPAAPMPSLAPVMTMVLDMKRSFPTR